MRGATPNHTIVSDVKGRVAVTFSKFGVSLAFMRASLPFTHHIVTLGYMYYDRSRYNTSVVASEIYG